VVDDEPVFPDDFGGVWTPNGFEKWRQRRFGELLGGAGLESGRPYDLRNSFASLLLHEGRDVTYVARQLGQGAELTLRTYGHVIEDLEDSPQLPAEAAIRRARAARENHLGPTALLRRVGRFPNPLHPWSAPSSIRTWGLLLRRRERHDARIRSGTVGTRQS
jgi:hypothetical protein